MSFLSQVQGRPVFDANGARVGMLRDLLIRPDVPYPPVESLAITHNGRLHAVPWHDVASVTPRGTALRGNFSMERYSEPSDDRVWLARDVLDKQIVDTSGVKLVRVNDVALTPLNDELRVAGVDNSTTGLFRRMGMERAARLFDRKPARLIDWEQVDIGPAVDDYRPSVEQVRLKVSYDRLKRLRPVDIAEVMTQMSPGEAADVLEGLDDETAARTMAELPDEHQAAVLSAMDPIEAADVLDEMEPDEAADVLGDVTEERAEELMALMEPAAADEVRSLLAYAEDTAGGLMNTCFVVSQASTVAEVVSRIRQVDDDRSDLLHTIFAVDDEGRLAGGVTLRDLLLANRASPVSRIMREDVEWARVDDPDDDVARKLVRYNLLALPVLDEERRVKGVVTVNDVLDLVTPRSWQRRGRRMMA